MISDDGFLISELMNNTKYLMLNDEVIKGNGFTLKLNSLFTIRYSLSLTSVSDTPATIDLGSHPEERSGNRRQSREQ